MGYKRHKRDPLSIDEMREKLEGVKEELQEVYEWEKEEEERAKDVNASPQKKAAVKRALKKIARRIDTINGQIIYWNLRLKGESHFRAGIEMNEYWAKCRGEE